MQKKSEDFSMEEALRLSKTPAGQQLITALQQADQSELQKIARQAAAGDYASAAQQLNTLLKNLGE